MGLNTTALNTDEAVSPPPPVADELLVRGLEGQRTRVENAITLLQYPQHELKAQAAALHDLGERQTALTRLDPEVARDFLSRVVATFNDVDGTLAIRGQTVLADGVSEGLRDLENEGVRNYMVTGKARSEIDELVRNIPPEIGARIIYEKGAFTLVPQSDGSWGEVPLLTTTAIVEAIASIKPIFYGEWAREIAEKYKVTIVPAGDGSHRSVLTYDILKPGSPTDLQELKKYGHRKEIKIADQELIAMIGHEALSFVRECGGDELGNATCANLGNANLEITASQIGKAPAILRTGELNDDRPVLFLGDSGNDQEMFDLARMKPASRGCLVYNPDSPDKLFNNDFVTVGEANAAAMFRLILEVRRSRVN